MAVKAPGKGILRVGAGNKYVANKTPAKAVAVAASQLAHSWGSNEATNVVDDWRKRTGYQTYAAPAGFVDMRDAHDCVTSLRKIRGVNVRHVSFTQVCDDAEPSKIAHDRVFSMLAYEAPFLGKVNNRVAVVCHINIHPNAVNHNPPRSSGVTREYIRSMQALDQMLTFAKAMGWLIVVSGDFNLTPTKAKDRAYLDSYDLFRKYRLTVKTQGLDGIAFDSRLSLVHWTVIPKGARTGADHPWVVADLKRKSA